MLFYYDISIHELPKKCKAEQIKEETETDWNEIRQDKKFNILIKNNFFSCMPEIDFSFFYCQWIIIRRAGKKDEDRENKRAKLVGLFSISLTRYSHQEIAEALTHTRTRKINIIALNYTICRVVVLALYLTQ